MQRKLVFATTFVFSIVFAVLLLSTLGSPAQAQQNCTEFRAIVQAVLPSPNPFLPTDVWGGPIYVQYGGELLFGVFSGNDGEPGPGANGKGRNGRYKVCFGDCTDSFIYEVTNAVWPFPPGKGGIGYYRGNNAKVVEGTGRFLGATGNLNIAGPFVVWTLDNGNTWHGRWDGEYAGNICGAR